MRIGVLLYLLERGRPPRARAPSHRIGAPLGPIWRRLESSPFGLEDDFTDDPADPRDYLEKKYIEGLKHRVLKVFFGG